MEKFVVIGSNSFSGAHTVAALLERGAEVLGISRSPEVALPFAPYRWGSSDTERFTFRQLDLNRDAPAIADAVREFEPEAVINFAAQSMVAESWLYPDQWYETNVVANVRLHEALRRIPGLRKYVHVSTPEVYGSMEGAVQEHTRYHPSTPYAASRAACDLHLMTFFRQYRFPVVFTRAANVYGPGQQLYRIIPKALLTIRAGGRLPLHGGGRSVRSFIQIRDVANATIRIAEQAEPPAIYHLATDETVSIRELIERICVRLGADFEALVEVTDDRPGKDAAYRLDWTRAREELGWAPRVTLDEGLAETAAWVERFGAALDKLPLHYTHQP